MRSLSLSLLSLSLLLHLSVATPPIDVTVTLRGESYAIKAGTIKELQVEIASKASLPIEKQGVLFKGKTITGNTDDIESLGISPNDVINIVPKKESAKKKKSASASVKPSTSTSTSTSTTKLTLFGAVFDQPQL